MRNSCVWEVTVEVEIEINKDINGVEVGCLGSLWSWGKNNISKIVSHVFWIIADTPEQAIAALKKETTEKGYKFLQETCFNNIEIKVMNINVTEIRRIKTVKVVDLL